MTAPTQIDDDWNAWTFDHCLFCGEPATVHGYVRLFEPVLGAGRLRHRTTWVRAEEIASNLAAAVHRAEREARE